MKELLKSVIYDQQEFNFTDSFLKRDVAKEIIESNEIIVISGIRRCGKSTLLHQIRTEMKEQQYFLNFDDDRLVNFRVENFQTLYETFIEIFGLQKTFYFDEIQNIEGWERFIRRLYDAGNKIFLTGSNARMLSRELGTHLTGRYYKIELFPFSFREFVSFRHMDISSPKLYSTVGRSETVRSFNEYFSLGGFPLYLINKNEQYLKSLYESILYRDVMVRNQITNEKEILELVYFLASNVSRLSSNNSLARITGVKNSTTIKNYLEYLQNTYLLFQVSKFDYSVSKQVQNPKKTYFIDNALVKRLGFQFSEENGRLLENLVFLELRRNDKEMFYFRGKYECDFLIRDGIIITAAIQVCYAFEMPETKERELNGLIEAMKLYHLSVGLIITNDNEEELLMDGMRVKIIPAWKWLLQISEK